MIMRREVAATCPAGDLGTALDATAGTFHARGARVAGSQIQLLFGHTPVLQILICRLVAEISGSHLSVPAYD